METGAYDRNKTQENVTLNKGAEFNPLLSKHPGKDEIDAYFALSGLGAILGTQALPEKYRTPALAALNLIEAANLTGNLTKGTSLKGGKMTAKDTVVPLLSWAAKF